MHTKYFFSLIPLAAHICLVASTRQPEPEKKEDSYAKVILKKEEYAAALPTQIKPTRSSAIRSDEVRWHTECELLKAFLLDENAIRYNSNHQINALHIALKERCIYPMQRAITQAQNSSNNESYKQRLNNKSAALIAFSNDLAKDLAYARPNSTASQEPSFNRNARHAIKLLKHRDALDNAIINNIDNRDYYCNIHGNIGTVSHDIYNEWTSKHISTINTLIAEDPNSSIFYNYRSKYDSFKDGYYTPMIQAIDEELAQPENNKQFKKLLQKKKATLEQMNIYFRHKLKLKN